MGVREVGAARSESTTRELRMLCGAPEEGTVEKVGNLLVTVGLNNITELIIGSGGISLDEAYDRRGGRIDREQPRGG